MHFLLVQLLFIINTFLHSWNLNLFEYGRDVIQGAVVQGGGLSIFYGIMPQGHLNLVYILKYKFPRFPLSEPCLSFFASRYAKWPSNLAKLPTLIWQIKSTRCVGPRQAHHRNIKVIPKVMHFKFRDFLSAQVILTLSGRFCGGIA